MPLQVVREPASFGKPGGLMVRSLHGTCSRAQLTPCILSLRAEALGVHRLTGER